MVGKGLIHCSERKAVCMQLKYTGLYIHECIFSTTRKDAVKRMPIFTVCCLSTASNKY